MSVYNLATTTINLYSPTQTKNEYGTYTTTYSIVEANIPARVQYRGGLEAIKNGKEKVITDHEIYIDKKITINNDYIIVDNNTSKQFDIQFLNKLYIGTHIQIYAKEVKDIITYV